MKLTSTVLIAISSLIALTQTASHQGDQIIGAETQKQQNFFISDYQKQEDV